MLITGVSADDAEGDVADYYESQRAQWGFLPHFTAPFSLRPAVAQAWQTLNLTIRGGMDRRRFEIATIAAARARGSTYCTVAHSMFLRDVCGDPATLDAINACPDGSGLTGVDRAVYELATRVATDPATIGEADVAPLRELGLSDADVVDVVLAAAARLFFTAVLDGVGARLDAQTAARFGPEEVTAMTVGRPPTAP